MLGDDSQTFPAHLWPRCARCKAPVSELAWWRDPVAGALVVEARCHGQKERSTLPDHVFMSMEAVEAGEAFREVPALPAAL